MAVTSIWAVSNRMDNTIKYVLNPEKTVERPELTAEALCARRAVGDVIDYATNGDKTEQMMFVTGINCTPETAVKEFMNTKMLWHKTGGRLAYHGYQSFREGDKEMTPEKAHEIGVKLAQELWGDRFEVIVATHLNTGHLHNHFLLNSVSFADGYKYHRTLADYRQMKKVSDRLCREARLHVVEDPSARRGKTYDEWTAERTGRPTIRGTIREDIDYAIRMSRSNDEFVKTMKLLGYEFKLYRNDGTRLVHPGIKPLGAKGYFRFESLGEDYHLDSIKRRIVLNTTSAGTPLIIEKSPYRKWEPPAENGAHGLARSYRRYCIRLYSYICKPVKKEYIPMALREDIIKLDNYIEQLDFLYGNGIESRQNLLALRDELQAELNELITRRRKLYSEKKKAVRHNDGKWITMVKNDISDTSRKIRVLKKKLKLCDAVVISSDRVTESVDSRGNDIGRLNEITGTIIKNEEVKKHGS